MSRNESPGAPNRRFGRYEVQRLLGQGGMGAVFLARQRDLERHVVIKVITDEGQLDPSTLDRFRREALAIAKVSSDHVVKVYEFGLEGGIPFLAMELVDGPSLEALLLQSKMLPYEQATRIIVDAARGLQAAHEVGVLHRDVKPGNILLTREGRAKVSDFNLAKVASAADLTQAGMTVGTPIYMAPEQAEALDALDARVDVYSLGVTFYELLTGQVPFAGELVSMLTAKLEGRYTPLRTFNARIPAAIEAACVALMAPNKNDRPRSMTEAVRVLESALERATGRRAPVPLSSTLTVTEADPFASMGSLLQARTEAGGSTAWSPPGEAPAEAGNELAVPGRFGRFAIERLLGQGGMGAVYAAREVALDRPCVVKVVKKELARKRDIVERLRREANAAAKISSDHVVKVYDFGIEGEVPFISMELVDGSSVDAVLKRSGRLSPRDATNVALAAAKGLEAAHEHGVFHRDVKPGNILIGKTGQVKVADFGLAKDVTAGALTAPGAVIGTPAYMSPEQIEAEPLDGRSDVFSLGATYYELLTGRVAYSGTSVMAVLMSRARPLPRPREVDAEIPEAAEAACLALMTAEKAKRPTMRAAIELLEKTLARLEGRGGPVDDPRRKKRFSGYVWLALAVVLSVLTLAAGLVVRFVR